MTGTMLKEVQEEANSKEGYYTVHVDTQGAEGTIKIPYVVFATSDYHAARLVRDETGYLASQQDVEGPYARI